MSDKKNSLEEYIARKLTEIGIQARRTRGSGCGNEIGDISCKPFYIECKIKHNFANIIADREKEIIKLKNSVPVNTTKELFWAYENKFGERYILLESETFFRLINKITELESEIINNKRV